MSSIHIRPTTQADFPEIIALSRRVYPTTPPWSEAQLASHLAVFPEGQVLATDEAGVIVGMSASLIVRWDDYEPTASWRDFTARGTFENHDPENGRTLYGAEVMVDPARQGRGIGKLIYARRRELVIERGLLRIRAGARLRGYSAVAASLTPRAYVKKVSAGELSDPTLTFQLRQGFAAIGVVSDYLLHDPDSLGYAAVIEWLNPSLTSEEDRKLQLRSATSDEPAASTTS
ncbi:hypothetical protein BH09MYX1_BH09MYX1_27520 [soil metagenome]